MKAGTMSERWWPTYGVVALIPKVMAATAPRYQFTGGWDFDAVYWNLVADRPFCKSGWLFLLLPYLASASVVINLGAMKLCQDDCKGWQGALETVVRLASFFVIVYLLSGVMYTVAMVLWRCCTRQTIEFGGTVRILLIGFLAVDIVSALLHVGHYLLGTLFFTADAVVIAYTLLNTSCMAPSPMVNNEAEKDADETSDVDESARSIEMVSDERQGSVVLPSNSS